jgi:ActR/RegA family two-component response regulator
MEEMKKEHFHNAYKFCGKDPVRTARLLGISRATVFRILAQNRKEIEEMCK